MLYAIELLFEFDKLMMQITIFTFKIIVLLFYRNKMTLLFYNILYYNIYIVNLKRHIIARFNCTLQKAGKKAGKKPF